MKHVTCQVGPALGDGNLKVLWPIIISEINTMATPFNPTLSAAIKAQRFTLTAEMLLKAFSQRANRFKLGTFLSETGLFTKALSKRYDMTMAYSP